MGNILKKGKYSVDKGTALKRVNDIIDALNSLQSYEMTSIELKDLQFKKDRLLWKDIDKTIKTAQIKAIQFLKRIQLD